MTLRRLPLRRSLREKKPGCHASASESFTAIAVPEFCDAAAEGPSQMARGQPSYSAARAGLELLPAHDERNPRPRRQGRREIPGETRKAMLGGGTEPGILQLIRTRLRR